MFFTAYFVNNRSHSAISLLLFSVILLIIEYTQDYQLLFYCVFSANNRTYSAFSILFNILFLAKVRTWSAISMFSISSDFPTLLNILDCLPWNKKWPQIYMLTSFWTTLGLQIHHQICRVQRSRNYPNFICF